MAGTAHFTYEVWKFKPTFIENKEIVLNALKIFREEAWENAKRQRPDERFCITP